jgi:predicted acylesterase/phospholipase RssA
MPIGIALSGGGSRGDFEVGAVRLLYERGIRPSILTGCSVGALNAAKLAEGPGALEDLIAIWQDLRYDADMWLREPWLKTLEPKAAALMESSGYGAAEFFGGLVTNAIISSAINLTGIPSFFFTAPGTLYTLITLGIDIAQVKRAVDQARKAKSTFSLSPIRARLEGHRIGWQMLGNPDDKGLTLEAVANADGRLEAFSVGTAKDFWHNWQTSPGGAWSGWQMLGNPDDKGLTLEAIANPDGRLEAFSVGTAQDFWHNWQISPGGAWSGWQMLGNPDDKGITLTVARNTDGRLEAFAIGTAQDFWHNWQTSPGGAWSGWQMLGNPDDKGVTLTVARNADGRLEAFAIGTAQDFWHNWQTSPGGAWSGWQMLGNPDDKGVTLEAIANADGRLEAFSVGTAKDFWHNWQTSPGGAWSGWQMLGNPDDKGLTLTVERNADGRLEAFSVGTAKDFWHNWQTSPGGDWSGWQMVGNPDDKGVSLTAARNADGRLEAFAIGTAQDYWHNWQASPGGSWSGEAKLLGALDPLKVRASGIALRIGAVSLESGAFRLVNERAQFEDTKEQLDLVDAVMASASIPVAFPPVKLGSENFIDGGVREMIPVASAVAAGADKVFAITAGPPRVDVLPSFDSAGLIAIGQRSIQELMLDEVLQNDLRPRRGWEVNVVEITPSIAVHDSLLIDPGLIRISMDYGYMRASDNIDPINDRTKARELSDLITQTRLDAWALEHSVSGELRPNTRRGETRPVPNPEALHSLRSLKRALFTMAAQRRCLGGALPPEHPAWWREFEAHQWEPLIPSPWDYLITIIGTAEKESGPGFLLQTGTALHETDATFAYLMTDWDQDGRPDLVAIKKSRTGTSSTEVHILSGSSNFSSFLLQTGTALHETDATFAFLMTDWDGDGVPDLVAIKRRGTGSGSTEVHILSGASNFQQFILQTGTALPETDSSFDFAMADWDRDGRPDLIAIKKSNTGTGSTEVHVLSGASNFQQFILQTGTALHETDNSFGFLTTDWDGDGQPDLVAIQRSHTGTCSTEIHVLAGSSNFGTMLYEAGSVLPETDSTFDFVVADWDADGHPDLVGIKKSGTGTHSTEVHIASV